MIRTPLRRRTPLRPRRKTRKGQIPEAVLDELWRKRIRQRDRTCRYVSFAEDECCHGPIQAAHVYSRTFRGIRWDPENGLSLCAKHHFFVHRNPVRAGRFYEAVLGRERLDWLWVKAQAAGKVDRAAVKDYLKAQLAEYEGVSG